MDNNKVDITTSKLREVELKLEKIEAEEVIINRISAEVSDRLEKKFSDRNLFALIVLIVTNVGGWGVFLPQAEQNIKNDIEDNIEQQVEDEVDKKIIDSTEELPPPPPFSKLEFFKLN
jgi:hypothetical protein